MFRNLNSHFAQIPQANIKRSKMDRNFSLKTSFNAGDVVPIFVDEVLPGDTFQIKTNFVVRMMPLVTAPMDSLFFDTYYFFVPNRLVWKHWKEFMGENTESAWYPETEYSVPQLNSGEGFEIGSIADYMGFPVGVPNLSVSALPFRAYSLIMNEWFRDENLVDPLETPMDDAQQTYTKLSSAYNPQQFANGGKPFVAAKAHDYFTSCLPSPQKGPDVSLGLVSGTGRVFTSDIDHDNNGSFEGIHYGLYNGGTTTFTLSSGAGVTQALKAKSTTSVSSLASKGPEVFTQSGRINASSDNTGASVMLYPTNLYSQLDSLDAVSINQLRQAIAIQHLLEIDARAGSRYTEIIHGHFGVTSPDSRLQRPEYLGGNRVPININQVVQMSGSTDTSPQGHVAGQSLTSDSHGDFISSFTEHGWIIGVAVCRYSHTYQQGIERMFSRKNRYDYFWPAFANLGEMAVLNKEIFAQGNDVDDEVFGYQEAFGDYRYKPSRVTGEMRSNHSNTLDSWHFADDYDTLPTLSAGWIQEDKNNIDRALAVSSAVSNQFFADFYIQNECTRPMPVYSVPGLERI